MIRFLLDGSVIEVDEADPTVTVLDYLRYTLRRTGTKEGCAEGDCGACTVLLGDLEGDALKWRAVNACILFLPMLDGRALRTVESLGGNHPVQRELVERHGSQCGFCTPGFVMSLYGRSIGAAGTEGVPVGDVIAGNLCRCTGYGPILAAGEAVPVAAEDDEAIVEALRALEPWLRPSPHCRRAGRPAPRPAGDPDRRRRDRRRPVGHQAAARARPDHLHRRHCRSEADRRGPGLAHARRWRPLFRGPRRRWPGFTPISASWSGGSAGSRSAMPARSGATSPMAHRSATCHPL